MSSQCARPSVGLNLLFLEPGATGGMETYARELVPELPIAMPEARFTVLAGRELADEWRSSPWHPEIELLDLRVSSATRVARTFWEQTLVPRQARRRGLNLLHSLSQSAPVRPPCASVVTIHDLIYATNPESSTALMNRGLGFLIPAVARSATRIIAPSNATRRAIEGELGIAPERIDVVPEGPGRSPPGDGAATDEEAIRKRLGLRDSSVILSVSARRPHKNLRRLVEAMALVPDAVLVLPGYATPFDDELRSVAVEAGVSDRVRLCGWLADAELEGLYRIAACMVFPSLAEGFGLPVLEAMERGVPVATSASTALAEVAGGAAVLFDPLSVGSIAGALNELLADPELCDRLVAGGREQARRFSWTAAAEGTVESYRRALAT